MKFAAVPMGNAIILYTAFFNEIHTFPKENEMKQSFPLEGFQILTNGTHSPRHIVFVE
jgi:hypothetical protein